MRREMARAAGRALERAKEEEKEVYRLEYVEGMNWQMASDVSHVGKSTYYRRREKLLREVAKELEA